ncbi:MAG: plasmid pRiA4b ORF-3 family protein [Desulfovibrio sp.]|jgi:hypothetical protein|nr:plasmid pRiA4b ORF-3 family protein [Desulfovibrio sp.]
MWVKAEAARHDAIAEKTIFRFEVRLLSGPVAPSFIKRNPEPPSRVIDIRGSQTLDALHMAIFRSFDREDAHMYEFQIGGKKPMARKAVRYSISPDDTFPEEKSAKTTTIAELNLSPGILFFYWFDFGDDWWHEIRLLIINPPVQGKGRYPRIVKKEGESPPQYLDWEAEEEDSEPDGSDFILPEAVRKREEAAAVVAEQRMAEISAMIENFCKSNLTEGYTTVCGELLDAAYAARFPLERGKAQSWAAGIIHAAGVINFLHDPASEPHMKLRDIAQHFGVSPATMENKSREIRNAVSAFPLDPRFCLPERMVNNPLIWMKQINGIIVDIRRMPREIQEAALKAGLIPFIPETPAAAAPPEPKAANQKKDKKAVPGKDKKNPDQYRLLE